MGKNLDPKCKQCRRVGEKLLLKGERCVSQKCEIVKRNYPPGFHGTKGKHRQSDYGMQLFEKQKARKTYGLFEKQFRLTYEKAKKLKGDTGKNLLKLLELRLDNAIYRIGFASSRPLARQLVNHGHFTVNSKKVDIPSYTLNPGDIIKIKESSKRSKYFKEWIAKQNKQNIPSWISFDKNELGSKILHQPKDEDVITNVDTRAIVEFYSR
jgi:small subunit ribosomal protein S4